MGNLSLDVHVLWQKCSDRLQQDLLTEEFNIWIRPLQLVYEDNQMYLFAPNRYVLEHVHENFLSRILGYLADSYPQGLPKVALRVGSQPILVEEAVSLGEGVVAERVSVTRIKEEEDCSLFHDPQADKSIHQFNFQNFVEGKSNQLALAASLQVAACPGISYNPLLIYGGVGLGKTHLMYAVRNSIVKEQANARVIYIHSEKFVADMVKALRCNAMNEFKKYYRSAKALLVDDIQFFAGKDRSQEEFFHTFNSLFDSQHQVIMTCDRYPKEIQGLEERLKSRCGWGLTVAVEPPDFETRVAILMQKAEQFKVELSHEVAFFMGKRIQSNVRELEGALRRVTAHAHFTGQLITLALAKEALKDLLAVHAKLVSIENIQKTVADYYKIKTVELLSKRRNRCLARARQVAMSLAKELTNHSLPEIGEAFGGRDHTTVLHACRKIKELMEVENNLREDYTNLLRVLST